MIYKKHKSYVKLSVILVCGYSRTGKDVFFSILSNTIFESPIFKWRCYQHYTDNKKFPFNNIYVRKSFADELKKEVCSIYNIPLFIDNKELKQFIHPHTKQVVSARDCYIEHALIRRTQDPLYWCKKIFNTSLIDQNITYVITDWRYENELSYIKTHFKNITTIRLFRSNVPIPHQDIISEHNIDKYTTDFLLLTENIHIDEFKKSLYIFPQYYDYIPHEII